MPAPLGALSRRSIVIPCHLTLFLAQALKTRLTDERTRSVLNLALPAVGEQMLNMLVGLADTFMVGHLGTSRGRRGGPVDPAVMLVTTFFAAVATGVTALVARHIEQGAEIAKGILGQGYLGRGTGPPGHGAEPGAGRADHGQHPRPRRRGGAGRKLPEHRLHHVPAGGLDVHRQRGAARPGDTRTPMLVMLAVNVVNIAVAYLFIYGPGPFPQLGVEGSALGAAAGRGVGGLLVTGLLLAAGRSAADRRQPSRRKKELSPPWKMEARRPASTSCACGRVCSAPMPSRCSGSSTSACLRHGTVP